MFPSERGRVHVEQAFHLKFRWVVDAAEHQIKAKELQQLEH